MTSAVQLQMGLHKAHRNRYLFSDHYLDNILLNDPRWDEALGEATVLLVWLQDLYAAEQQQLAKYTETQLEDQRWASRIRKTTRPEPWLLARSRAGTQTWERNARAAAGCQHPDG